MNIKAVEPPGVLAPPVRVFIKDKIYALFHTLLLNVVYLDKEAFEALKNGDGERSKFKKEIFSVLSPAGFIKDGEECEDKLIDCFLEQEIYKRRRQNSLLRPNFVRLILTEKCNLKCDYCFVSKSASGVKVKDPLVSDLIKELEPIIKMNSGKDLCIQYFGGEPTLRLSDILSMSKEIKKLSENFGTSLTETMVTNGLLLNKISIEKIKNENIHISISLDGCDVASTLPRFGKSAKKRIEKISDVFNMMKDIGIPINVNLTPSQYNITNLPEIINEMGLTYGVNCVFVNTPIGWDYSSGDIEPSFLASQLFKACSEASKVGIRFVSIVDRFIRGLDEHTPQVEDCIAPNGGVSLSLYGKKKWSLCDMNWHESSFLVSKLPSTNSEELKNFKFKKMFPFEECTSCNAKMLCGGPCPNEFSIGQLNGNSYRCKFFRSAIPLSVYYRRYG